MAKKRRKQKKSGWFSKIMFWIAMIVFIVSGVQLIKIGTGYMKADLEYKKANDIAIVTKDKPIEKIEPEEFQIDFDALLKKNPETVGWIRFYPEPKEINYPIVQGKDNDEYLHKTFEGNASASGAIFIDVENAGDFSDRNTVIYGHRMKNGSMFRHLQDYDTKKFWEENPFFYIYTPDGEVHTYQIFSAGVVKDTGEVYQKQFMDDEDFQKFLENIRKTDLYDTGIEVGVNDRIVTLSTCTSASDEHRFVVCGVKREEATDGGM